MRVILILMLLSTSLLSASPTFKQEVADSLLSEMETYLNYENSYYFNESHNRYLDIYLLSNLTDLGFDLRNQQSIASHSLYFSLEKNISTHTKKSFFLTREVKNTDYIAIGKIINNSSLRVEHYSNITLTEEQAGEDSEVYLWKPLLISLLTGTLVYSLWSIE